MMTFDDVRNMYDCEVFRYKNMINNYMQVVFKFKGFCLEEIITLEDQHIYSMDYLESRACTLAVNKYMEHVNTKTSRQLAKAGVTLKEACDKIAAWTPMAFEQPNKRKLFTNKKQNISECYTIGFDISGGKDVSVASVFRVRGSDVKLVNTFTGDEAEWMYDRITKNK